MTRLPPFCYDPRLRTDTDGVVLHYVSAIYVAPDRWDDPETIRDMLINLNSPADERWMDLPGVGEARQYASYHTLIDRDGGKHVLMPDENRAYHAGVSSWAGRKNLNGWTRGLAFIATHSSGFTGAQYLTGQTCVAQDIGRYGFELDNVIGHSDCATGRKKDPGPLFDWHRFKGPLRNVI